MCDFVEDRRHGSCESEEEYEFEADREGKQQYEPEFKHTKILTSHFYTKEKMCGGVVRGPVRKQTRDTHARTR